MTTTLRISALAFVLTLGACASDKKLVMDHSPAATSAQTKIDVKKTPAGTAAVKLEVKHLAQPEKVKEGSTAYVMWARPTDREGVTMNLGSFKPDGDLKARIESVTPYQKFKLFVTPEGDRTALTPSADPVLWTDVSL